MQDALASGAEQRFDRVGIEPGRARLDAGVHLALVLCPFARFRPAMHRPDRPLNLRAPPARGLYDCKSCLSWFARVSLTTRACTVEVGAPGPIYGPSRHLCGVGQVACEAVRDGAGARDSR